MPGPSTSIGRTVLIKRKTLYRQGATSDPSAPASWHGRLPCLRGPRSRAVRRRVPQERVGVRGQTRPAQARCSGRRRDGPPGQIGGTDRRHRSRTPCRPRPRRTVLHACAAGPGPGYAATRRARSARRERRSPCRMPTSTTPDSAPGDGRPCRTRAGGAGGYTGGGPEAGQMHGGATLLTHAHVSRLTGRIG